MRIYVASKSRHWPFWAALRAAGIDIASGWLDWSHNHDDTEPSADEWRHHVEMCLAEATAADLLLFYAENGEQQFGALLECGAALAAGREVWLVSPHPWPFLRRHPRVREFKTLADAISAILAEQRRDELRPHLRVAGVHLAG